MVFLIAFLMLALTSHTVHAFQTTPIPSPLLEGTVLPQISPDCNMGCINSFYTQYERSLRVWTLSSDLAAPKGWSCSENCNMNIPLITTPQNPVYVLQNARDTSLGIIGHTPINGMIANHVEGVRAALTNCSGETLLDLTNEGDTVYFYYATQNPGRYCFESPSNVYGLFEWPKIGGGATPDPDLLARVWFFPFLPFRK